MAGLLQNEDHKSLSELTGAGGTVAQLLNDTKIYVSANSINKQLSQAITDGDIGGGGSGGGVQWVESGLSPLPAVENNVQVYLYESAGSQNLYTIIKVPNQYNTKQIKMRMAWYSPDSSGTGLIRAQATLIRPNTDQMSSTTNQRTTTNAAITLTGSTVNKPQSVVLDLTSTVGQINSTTVSANDFIIVRLYRDTDTATSEIRVIVNSLEVGFNG